MAYAPTPSVYVPLRRRRSLFGPLFLIVLGVLFLLGNLGVIGRVQVALWFATWWPAILILWGVVRIVEWYLARKDGVPAPRFGAGGVLLLLFLCLIGLGASRARNIDWLALHDRMQFNDDFNDVFTGLGQRHEFNETADQEFKPGALLRIDKTRGDVHISPSPDNRIHVSAHNTIYGSDADARRIEEEAKPAITVQGDVFVLDGGKNGQVKSDLEIEVPRQAGIELSSGSGDLEIDGIAGDVRANTGHGDITFKDIVGNATANAHGSVTASNISGTLSILGRLEGVTVSEAEAVALEGEFYGDTRVERIAKSVRFHSSRTDLQLGGVPGTLALESDALRANGISGPIELRTRAKDIQLENFSGEVSVSDSDGDVELRPQTVGAISVENRKGEIKLFLPRDANSSVDARVTNGDIESDFAGLQTQSARGGTQMTGTIGKGGPRISLSTDRASIEIRKG